MPTTRETPPVVVVAVDRDAGRRYASWLDPGHQVRTVRDAAAEATPGAGVAVVAAADPEPAVAARHRRRTGAPRALLVVDRRPGFDAPDAGYDDLLVEPPSAAVLRESVTDLVRRERYADGVRELYELARRRAAVESAGRTDAAPELDERLGRLQERLDATLDDLTADADFADIYLDLERASAARDDPSDAADPV